MKEKPNVCSPFFGAFPSDSIPKATKEGNVHFFIHSSNSCKLNHRISVTFLSYYMHLYLADFFLRKRMFQTLVVDKIKAWYSQKTVQYGAEKMQFACRLTKEIIQINTVIINSHHVKSSREYFITRQQSKRNPLLPFLDNTEHLYIQPK